LPETMTDVCEHFNHQRPEFVWRLWTTANRQKQRYSGCSVRHPAGFV
jgi:hypothetical protein